MTDKKTSVSKKRISTKTNKPVRKYTVKEPDYSKPISPAYMEVFCQMRLYYSNAEAFIIAKPPQGVEFEKGMYIKPSWRSSASILANNPKVQARLLYLKEEEIKSLELDKTSRIQNLHKNLILAEESNNHSAIVKYHDLITKLIGDAVTSIDLSGNLKSNTTVIVTQEEVDKTLKNFKDNL